MQLTYLQISMCDILGMQVVHSVRHLQSTYKRLESINWAELNARFVSHNTSSEATQLSGRPHLPCGGGSLRLLRVTVVQRPAAHTQGVCR